MLTLDDQFYFSVKSIIFTLIVFNFTNPIESYLKIHESCIWIPTFNYGEPYFMWHPERNFIETEFTSIPVNINSVNDIPEELKYNFSRAYSLYGSVLIAHLLYENLLHYTPFRLLYNSAQSTVDSFPLPSSALSYNRFIMQGPSNTYITLTKTISLVNNQTSKFLLRSTNFDPDTLYEYNVPISGINLPSNSFKFFHGFLHENYSYWIGHYMFDFSQTYTLSQLYINHGDNYNFTYELKEFYSSSFHINYGIILNVQFAESDQIFKKGDEHFSKQIFFSYRKNMKDYILALSLLNISNDFQHLNDNSCSESQEVSWWNFHYYYYESCIKLRQSSQVSFFSQQSNNLVGHTLEILDQNWTRIVDFVPLAWEDTPLGYILLILSSDENYSQYRYSVHFMENYSKIRLIHQRIFQISYPANNQTKIYYYNISQPQVIISIDEFHFREEIFGCDIYESDCVGKLSDKIFTFQFNTLILTVIAIYTMLGVLLAILLSLYISSKKKRMIALKSVSNSRLLRRLRARMGQRQNESKSPVYMQSLRMKPKSFPKRKTRPNQTLSMYLSDKSPSYYSR